MGKDATEKSPGLQTNYRANHRQQPTYTGKQLGI